MHIIPLKEKYNLEEEDINLLAAWIIEGRSLEEIYFYFSSKLTIQQIFIAADIISNEMYDMPLKELAPELIAQRRTLNEGIQEEWQKKKNRQKLMSHLGDVTDDLAIFNHELHLSIEKKAHNC